METVLDVCLSVIQLDSLLGLELWWGCCETACTTCCW